MIELLGVLFIAITWLSAPWLGLFVTGYSIYKYFKNEHDRILEGKKRRKAQEAKERKMFDDQPRPMRTADEIFPYKRCIIEIYRQPLGEDLARIITPQGKDLGRSFKSVSKAVANIDDHIH